MTPATTPTPIFTHKLPESFFTSNSPHVPISPISNLASRASSFVSSPHIHPAVNSSIEDPIDKCIENLNAAQDNTSLDSDHSTNDSNKRETARQQGSYRLSLDDFVIKQTVGTGSSARVHLAECKIDGKYYAIKAINKTDLLSKRQVEHANNERDILGYVSHPFLVKLWGSFQSESHVFLVMDYIPGGELFHQLRKNKVTFKLLLCTITHSFHHPFFCSCRSLLKMKPGFTLPRLRWLSSICII